MNHSLILFFSYRLSDVGQFKVLYLSRAELF